MPRRTAIGVDHNRVSLLVAVLDKICGLHLGGSDIFINVAGGVRVEEPAVDLGIVAAMASSFLDRPVDARTIVLGEVGLAGEVRAVSQVETRVKEAARLGFNRCIVPKSNMPSLAKMAKVEIFSINSLAELLENLF
jgi:DNA repair protein RadA/Sms